MSNTVLLGDIASLKTGPFGTQLSASEYVNDGIPVINVRNIGYGEIITSDLEYVGEETAKRLHEHLLHKGDIVFGRKGSVDRHAFIDTRYDGWMQGSDCIRVRINEGINPHYISHYLKLESVKKQINSSAVGSTMASLNTDILGRIQIVLPSLEIQNRIEKLLSVIEEKIDLNKHLCTEMEAMAKTLYDYWFVQFDFPDEHGRPYRTSGGEMEWCPRLKKEIPKGWKTGNLYDIADYINGLACQNYRPAEGDSSLPVIKIREMHEGISADTESVSANIPTKYIIEDGDILFSWSATLEVMYWTGGKGGLNQHIFKVIPKEDYPKEYVYHQLSTYIINFVKMAEARKTTMGHITSDHMQQSRIVLPPTPVLRQFHASIAATHDRIIRCKKENRELSQLRNWLLPMLMNGQAKLK